MNSISACMIVLNEVDIIEYSLTNPLKVFDSVIIIDGGSTDGTVEKIKEIAKKLNLEYKLNIIINKFKTLNEQRNLYIQHCKTDFIMYIDADEVFEINELFKIKSEYINQYELILVRSRHLYIDLWHEAISSSWENSYMMPRIYKRYPLMYYTPYVPKEGDHTLMIGKIYFMDFFKGRMIICDKNDISVKHYGHARGPEKEKQRLKFFLNYDSPTFPKSRYDDMIKNNSYFDSRFWEQGINADPKGIIKFTGKHPEIMKKHPLYNVRIIKD